MNLYLKICDRSELKTGPYLSPPSMKSHTCAPQKHPAANSAMDTSPRSPRSSHSPALSACLPDTSSYRFPPVLPRSALAAPASFPAPAEIPGIRQNNMFFHGHHKSAESKAARHLSRQIRCAQTAESAAPSAQCCHWTLYSDRKNSAHQKPHSAQIQKRCHASRHFPISSPHS